MHTVWQLMTASSNLSSLWPLPHTHTQKPKCVKNKLNILLDMVTQRNRSCCWRFSWLLPFVNTLLVTFTWSNLIFSWCGCFMLKLNNLKWQELLLSQSLEFDVIFFFFKEREMLLHTVIYFQHVNENDRCWFHFFHPQKMFKLLTEKY